VRNTSDPAAGRQGDRLPLLSLYLVFLVYTSLGREDLLWQEQCPTTPTHSGWGASRSTHPVPILLAGQRAGAFAGAGVCPGSWCSALSPPQKQASGVGVQVGMAECLPHAAVPRSPSSKRAGSCCLAEVS